MTKPSAANPSNPEQEPRAPPTAATNFVRTLWGFVFIHGRVRPRRPGHLVRILGEHGESTHHGTGQAAPVTAELTLLIQAFHQRITGELPTVDDVVTWLRRGGIRSTMGTMWTTTRSTPTRPSPPGRVVGPGCRPTIPSQASPAGGGLKGTREPRPLRQRPWSLKQIVVANLVLPTERNEWSAPQGTLTSVQGGSI